MGTVVKYSCSSVGTGEQEALLFSDLPAGSMLLGRRHAFRRPGGLASPHRYGGDGFRIDRDVRDDLYQSMADRKAPGRLDPRNSRHRALPDPVRQGQLPDPGHDPDRRRASPLGEKGGTP